MTLRKRHAKPDLGTLGGLAVALVGMGAGLALEGGRIEDVSQVSAALVVFGGTLGAVMITTPARVLAGAARCLRHVFIESPPDMAGTVREIVRDAIRGRREGPLALEQAAEATTEPFLQKGLLLAVDGVEPQEIRRILDIEIGARDRELEAEAEVFDVAAGYCPTIGIIGAVLGLIQVMKHLSDMDAVGKGIAVAFVATVYGVGMANLFLLPAAGKVRARARQEIRLMHLMAEGVVAVAEGVNPRLIRGRLDAIARTDSRAAEVVANPVVKAFEG